MNERRFKVAITLDDKNGMMFNRRRQSRDRNLIADLCTKTKGYVYISHYSALLFEEYQDRVKIVDHPLSDCEEDDVAFIEGLRLSDYVENIDELIVYRWNRLYPSDIKLDINIEACGFKLFDKYDFLGNSHEKITKEVYKKHNDI